MGHGGAADPLEVQLICEKWHAHHQWITAEQVMSFRLENDAGSLLGRAIWVEGDDHPLSDNPHFLLPPEVSEPGNTIEFFDDISYVVTSVEVDRVWVRPLLSD